jgi:hypothetical protein
LTGHGTLVVSESLFVQSGATLDWNGDVIVLGTSGADALISNEGNISVTGNFVLIGDDNRDVSFVSKPGAGVTVNGALTVLTDYSNTGTKAQFLIESDMQVTGLLTLMAGIHQTEFKPSCNVQILGSLQMGLYSNVMQFKVEDDVEIVADAAAVQQALAVMSNGFPSAILPGGSGGGLPGIERFGWHVQHETPP